MEKVKIKSMVGHKVSVVIPELRFSRSWNAVGAIVSVDKELLEELMNNTGFYNMLTMGILYIEDMDVKKDLGLEPEDAVEPTNIIVLSDKDKRTYLTTLSLVGFRDKIKKLSNVQLQELCDYAIDNRLVDMDKCELLKEACGRDIIKAITLKKQDEEA